MSISAAEASSLTGKSKQAVINAIKSGKISAIKDVDGTWQIEPVELFRYYQPVSSNGASRAAAHGHQVNGQLDDTLPPLDTPSVDGLQTEIRLLRELLETKDAVIAAKDDAIGDLRARLNVEQEERRRLTMILTAAQAAPKSKGFWARLFGGGE